MKIKTQEVRDVVELLDDIVKEYKSEKKPKKRDWRTYEHQLSVRIRGAIRNLEPLIEEAIVCLKIVKTEPRGRKPKLTPKQRVELLLIKHLVRKSNREMANLLILLFPCTDVQISYKTIERLYSNKEVVLTLHNLQALIIRKAGIEQADCTGDGTGYSLTIKKHYATEAHKLKTKSNDESELVTKFIFSFQLMDLKTRLYIGFGTSFRSEQEAFEKAMAMAENVDVNSFRLDRYYSAQHYVNYLVKRFGKDITMYLIPKKNVTVKGSWKWKQILHAFVNDTKEYLGEYYQRNQSESAISEDKRRFGWKIPQRRRDRIETYNFCTSLWHNLLWLGGQ